MVIIMIVSFISIDVLYYMFNYYYYYVLLVTHGREHRSQTLSTTSRL